MNENDSTIELIKQTIEKIRPFINRDGGDVSFDSFEDGIVYVSVHGACQGCALISSTLYDGIETLVMEEVPGVLAVRLSEDKEKIQAEMAKIKSEESAKN